jgi:hypothetical protein
LSKNIHEDQWNRIEEPDMNPHSYAHLVFDKGSQKIRWTKDSLFSKRFWGNWKLDPCRKLKLDPCLSPCIGIMSNWINDLNIRPETLKLAQERVKNTLG